MNLSEEVGNITKEKKSNFILPKEILSYSFIPYNFGSNIIDTVFIDGQVATH